MQDIKTQLLLSWMKALSLSCGNSTLFLLILLSNLGKHQGQLNYFRKSCHYASPCNILSFFRISNERVSLSLCKKYTNSNCIFYWTVSKFLLGAQVLGANPKFMPIGIEVNDIKILCLLSTCKPWCMSNNLHVHLFQRKYYQKTLLRGGYLVKSELETPWKEL